MRKRKLVHIERLAPAIVKQAVQEYRNMLKRCGTWQRYWEDDSAERKELEDFFRSRWCAFLTEDNGVAIMRTLRREAFGQDQARRMEQHGGHEPQTYADGTNT